MLVTLSILSSIFYAIFGTSTSVMSTVPNHTTLYCIISHYIISHCITSYCRKLQ